MKTKPVGLKSTVPSEDDIRDYAYHLYVQNGMASGHDLENWLEARSCLEANTPKERSHTRLHRHRHPAESDEPAVGFREPVGPALLLN